MSLVIRSAIPADAGLVLTFIRELAEYEKLLHEVEAREEDIARDLFGEQPRVFCEIAEWGGEPVGFALWFYTYSTFQGRHGLYLEDLFVRPAQRGRGIGKALLANLARRCLDEGLGRLRWWVLNWNEPSIAFYRSLGADARPEWTTFDLSGEALHRLAQAGGPTP
ncbi:MAG: GNAT family N-acetyltransferase [Hyphomicrobiales bacterium]|nr:GNAT family N-acetyltransferase [Hyphomicrobiales bacterium]